MYLSLSSAHAFPPKKTPPPHFYLSSHYLLHAVTLIRYTATVFTSTSSVTMSLLVQYFCTDKYNTSRWTAETSNNKHSIRINRLYGTYASVHHYSAQVTVPLSPCLVLFSQSPLRSQWPCLSSCGMLGHVTRPGTADAPSPAGTEEQREWQQRERGETRYALLWTHATITAGSHNLSLFFSFLCFSCCNCRHLLRAGEAVFFPSFLWFSPSLPLSLSCFLDYTGFQPMNNTALQAPGFKYWAGTYHVAKQGRDRGELLQSLLCCKMEEALHLWPLPLFLYLPPLIHELTASIISWLQIIMNPSVQNQLLHIHYRHLSFTAHRSTYSFFVCVITFI